MKNNEKPSSLEKAKSLLVKIEEKREDLKNLSNSINVDESIKKSILREKLEKVEEQIEFLKEEIDQLNLRLEEIIKERKEIIENVRNAVREVISDDVTKDIMDNSSFKKEIYGDDEDLLNKKRNEQKELEMELEISNKKLAILEEQKWDLYDSVYQTSSYQKIKRSFDKLNFTDDELVEIFDKKYSSNPGIPIVKFDGFDTKNKEEIPSRTKEGELIQPSYFEFNRQDKIRNIKALIYRLKANFYVSELEKEKELLDLASRKLNDKNTFNDGKEKESLKELVEKEIK